LIILIIARFPLPSIMEHISLFQMIPNLNSTH
jgi:hypothetical protein